MADNFSNPNISTSSSSVVISGTVPVSGTVTVLQGTSPWTVTASGSTVNVGNFPATQVVTQGTFPWTVTTSGSTVNVGNFPIGFNVNNTPSVSQNGIWTVGVSNTVGVSGTVNVGNFPATQAVTQNGNWNVGLNVNQGTLYSSKVITAQSTGVTAVSAAAGVFGGYSVFNTNANPIYIFFCDAVSGSAVVTSSIWCQGIPANSSSTLGAGAVGFPGPGITVNTGLNVIASSSATALAAIGSSVVVSVLYH